MRVLDTFFRLVTTEPELLAYSQDIAGAYADGGPEAARTVTVTVERGKLPEGTGRPTGVHRSKHAYWTFDCEVLGPGLTRWNTRGVAVRFDGDDLHITVAPATSPAVAGEAVFHVLRSVALYRRDTTKGSLVHASGVVSRDGAVLFTGSVLAGKTTVMTEAVLRHGATPLTNDRTWLTDQAVSWPSYASFCEGTLLSHPELTELAARYERDDCPHRTQSWRDPLRMSFEAKHKRVYPMGMLADAIGTRFQPQAPLRALVLTRCSPDVRSGEPEPVDDRELVERELARQNFDLEEPSFLPWHGLASPVAARSTAELVDRLMAAGTAVLRLTVNPADLAPIKELL